MYNSIYFFCIGEKTLLEKHTRINISLPISLDADLSMVAKELNDKKSHIIARELDLYFDELDARIADKRYDNYKNGKAKTLNLSDIEEIFG